MTSKSLTGLSPNNPLKYMGAGVSLVSIVTRNRAPTSADIKQPTTGKYYPFGSFWLVGEDPSSGNLGDLWYLAYIQDNQAMWRKILVE
jgi:hypothetical protein